MVSVVVACFNEEENIDQLLNELKKSLHNYKFEIILVDDGSTDRTLQFIKAQAKKDSRIKMISFLRNFGQQMAFTAGYEAARGNCVVTIDADLQDPPELIVEMVEKWRLGYKIVYAKRVARDEDFFKRLTAHWFYWLINNLSSTPVPPEVGDYRLVDREVVEILKKMPEKARFLRGLIAWGGFTSIYVTFARKKRVAGVTHYTFSRMLGFAFDGITSFSTKPLRIATYLGFVTSIIGFIGILYAIARRLLLPHEYWVTGWTALFVAVIFFGGIQLITIGIIGEYIGKIF